MIGILINKIMAKHKVYCTASIKPAYDKTGNNYTGICLWEVYISRMPSGMGFYKNLTFNDAVTVLSDYLDGKPKDAFDQIRKERLSELRNSLAETEQEIRDLEAEQ